MDMHSRNIVLVAEAQGLVRGIAADVLNDHGYEVLEADCTEEVLSILAERGDDIRVLFADISLPGSMDGLTLAHTARRICPWIGLLITSGNARMSVAGLPEGSRFLAKVYDVADMASHVGALTTA